jgi:predicted metal-dependent phosphoesterase TrpH
MLTIRNLWGFPQSSMVVFSATQPLAQDTRLLKSIWTTIDPDSCPYHYNFHLHTLCSDGQLTPEALIKQALDIGLQGLAITDHHSIEGYQRARSWLEDSPNDRHSLHLWTGIEITSELLDTEVHILGYGFDPAHPLLKPYLQGSRLSGHLAQAVNVISALHQAGGLVVLAHPFRYHRPAQTLIAAAVEVGIDGIEAFYAYSNPKPWKPSPIETERAIELSQQYRLLTTCGTDSHGKSLLHRI